MKKIIITFLIGLVLGSCGSWILHDSALVARVRGQPAVAKAIGLVQERALERAGTEVKDEMTRNGKVVMTKSASQAVAIEDDLLNDLVKAKVAADPFLAKASIKASAKKGQVELSGSALSYEQVARALRLALECDATSEVVSTIVVKTP